MKFEERIMDLRKQKGWSQEEFGEKLGVTRQTVSKWELGSTTPEMEKLVAMSELFGISLDELVKGIEPSQKEIQTEIITEKKRFRMEYKSEKTVRGMPLVHINLKGKATGFISIGLISRGFISIGLLSLGVVSLGLLSLGVIALGAVALGIVGCAAIAAGVLAVGGVAAGVFAVGGISFGLDTAIGGIAKNVEIIDNDGSHTSAEPIDEIM